MSTEKKSKWFPDPTIVITEGAMQEGGTSIIDGQEKGGPQRWVKVNNIVFTRVDDGLYHTRYGDVVRIAHDSENRMIGYNNLTTDAGSKPSMSAVRGVIAFMFILSGALYLLGAWNFIWKSIHEWWITVAIIAVYSMYALVWTPMYAVKEWKRQQNAHDLLKK